MNTSVPAACMTRREFLIAAGAALLPGATLAQEYPSKTIRMVSPFSPGATSDLVARAIGPALAAAFGVSVVVENKPGGGGIVGADFVAKAAPDGHTLLVAAASIGVIPALHAKLPFELYRDLQPITLAHFNFLVFDRAFQRIAYKCDLDTEAFEGGDPGQ